MSEIFHHKNPFRLLQKNTLVLVIICFFAFGLLPSAMAADVGDRKAKFHLKHWPKRARFHLEEATIADIHHAIRTRQITVTELVHMYLNRIRTYSDEQCVTYSEGFLGPTIKPIPNASQVNAFTTLNLRPDTLKALGFNDRKARSQTDLLDNDTAMPDALEVAAALDAHFARTGKLIGPLHGIPIAIKDQVDTFDMRTTSGDDAFYDDVRPPDDATIVAKLREAGAIIIGKALSGDYARGSRSSWGGQTCNPYDTTRNPSSSSAGSGVIPAANLAVCAIAEDTGGSIRGPAAVNNVVGIRPTFGLVSTDGLFFASMTRDTLGPICRNVKDTAIVLDVIKGFDLGDPRTAASINRIPSEPYSSLANEKSLDGIRIGVVGDVMVERSLADQEVFRVVNEAIDDLESLGAKVIHVNMKNAIAQHLPSLQPSFLLTNFPDLFPTPPLDAIGQQLELLFDPSLVPVDDFVVFGEFDLFSPGDDDDGETKYAMNVYLRQRGDTNIQSVTDLIENHNSFVPSRLEDFNTPTAFENSEKILRRSTVQQIVLIMMAENQLDALVFPARDLPVERLDAPSAPSGMSQLSLNPLSPMTGFPSIVVPAGFSEVAFDWEIDPETSETILVGPKDIKMPIAIELFGKPFDEPTLFKIASAYEAATRHRTPPPAFGPLSGEP